MMAIGISTLVGGFTGSAFAQGDNQTNVGQGKIIQTVKIGQGLKDILGGGGSQ